MSADSPIRGTDGGRISFIPPVLMGALILAVVFVLLELAVRSDLVSRLIIALPSDVLMRFGVAETRDELLSGFVLTFGVTAFALLLELLVALPLGVFLYMRRDFGMAYAGWLMGIFAAPTFLLYPLFMVLFGRNMTTLIVMGFLSGVIPIIIQVEQGLLAVSKTFVNVGTSFGASRWQIVTKIMIPAAAPSIFTGFRLALIYTLINIVAIEYLVDVGGLGRIVADKYGRFDIVGTYTAIIAVMAVSALLNGSIGAAERRIR